MPAKQIQDHSQLQRKSASDDENENEAPCEHLQPATRAQFASGAIIQHSATPIPLFEHEDEHEHEDDWFYQIPFVQR
jgi:hypothetical protein